MKLNHTGKSVSELYFEFKNSYKHDKLKPKKLRFKGVDGYDVYNVTAPFDVNGTTVLAGRVEKRDSENSKVMFFEVNGSECCLVKDALIFDLQDPAVTKINNELILSGVEIFEHPILKGQLWWKTVFYKGKDIFSLKRFASGPNGMKDIRLVGLNSGRVGIFTRQRHPMGEVGSQGGRGTIGYAEVNSINEVNAEIMDNAFLLDEQVHQEDWLGANEIHILKNGLFGVLSHVAMYDENNDRHYYAAVFAFEHETKSYSTVKIIAERSMFEHGPCKKPDLADVIFSGGLIRKDNSKAVIYVGTGDTEGQMLEIDDPFFEYENIKL